MKYILSFLYPLMCVFTPCLVFLLISKKRHQEKISIRHFIWVYVFLLYLFLAISIAGSGSIWDIGQYETVIRTNEINIVPFSSKGAMTYILNIIMFMPLGFLLPHIWEKCQKFWKVILYGFGFSFTIEMSQLFNKRITDVDDLLMNTLGAIIGYMIWILFKKLNFSSKKIKYSSLSPIEPTAYILLAVLGNFILYNWKLIV